MAQYFATVARGLEEIAARELEGLGAQSVRPEFAGVAFAGDRTLLYRVNLWGRTLFRVLVPMAEFRCTSAPMLYREVRAIDWENYLSPENTLAVDCTGKNQQLNHTHFSALQVKNAIVDRQRDQFGVRSSVDVQNPDLRLNLHIHRDRAVLSLDSSGNSLHRRGYRPAVGSAPLKETLAAALLEIANYSPEMPFLDPLCGSGTLPLEAAMKAGNVAPGLFRDRFGFETWRDFDAGVWQQLKEEAKGARKIELPAFVGGSDRDGTVLQQAKTNAEGCGLSGNIRFQCADVRDIEAPCDRGILMCNPPYGERLGDRQQLGAFYKQLGDTFKQRFKGWTAYVLTGSKDLAKRVGLRASRRIPVSNGGLDCTLLEYELY
ncbi:THUMP domain-containing class I SAM-dependent RNA methyltransferase [Baaleninema sp.]|uniref:THUMP domain-containing class I SAM-dependent RNA methyltransferase n=1 Tax=Baaleninema sp. TaxID=3101197 RepID=UPI003D03FD76